MKPTTINVQITKCPKQFEAVRLGLDATLEPNETVESAIKAATEQLSAIYTEMYAGGAKVAQNAGKAATNASPEQAQEPAQKELLKFDSPKLQSIVKRIEKEPDRKDEIIEKARKYFNFDADAEKVLSLAAKIIFNN